VTKVTSVSLGYPLSVFNKNSTLKERIVLLIRAGRNPEIVTQHSMDCPGTLLHKISANVGTGTCICAHIYICTSIYSYTYVNVYVFIHCGR